MVSRMSLNGALNAEGQEKHNVMAMVDTAVDTEHRERCSRSFVPSVELTPKYLSNLVRIDLSIVATATIRSKPNKLIGKKKNIHRFELLSLCMFFNFQEDFLYSLPSITPEKESTS